MHPSYDLTRPEVRKLLIEGHQPAEHVAGDVSKVYCPQCMHSWPCPVRIALEEWSAEQVRERGRIRERRERLLAQALADAASLTDGERAELAGLGYTVELTTTTPKERPWWMWRWRQ